MRMNKVVKFGGSSLADAKQFKKVKDIILSNPKVSGTNQVYFSSEMQKILAKAEKEMASLHDEFLSTEHLLLSIAKSDGKVADLLKSLGINHQNILQAIKSVRGNQTVDSQDPESKTRSLEKYCK